jgi:sterol desaturase/sphingolipid hydroxylase (fatty acid hydroxylase superfamily)
MIGALPARQAQRIVMPSAATLVTAAAIAAALAVHRSSLPVLAVGIVVFTPLERLRPRRRQAVSRREAFVNLAHLTATTSLTTALLALAMSVITLLPHLDAAGSWIGSLPLPVSMVLVVLIGDTGYYWAHRTLHTSALLWRFHRIHHSSRQMNWLAAARAHPVDQLILHMGWLLPLYALGVHAAWFGAYAAFLTMQTLLVHSNVDVSARPLRWLVVTPDFHHWHHTAERDAWNRNFAGQLPLLDRVFGTWWLPAGRRVERYGVADAVPASYPGQLLAR